MRTFTTVLCAIALPLTGCTTTLASHADSTPTSGYRAGIPYRLPVLQYRISAHYKLAGCELDEKGLLPVKVEITAEPSVVEGEARVIDYARLSSAFKTTSISVEYWDDTQILKSIGASATDHGSEVVGNLVKSAATIGRIAFGLGPAAGGRPQAVDTVSCRPDVARLVQASGLAAKALKDLTEQSQAVADRLAVYKTEVEIGALTPADKAKAAADIKLSKKLEGSLAKLKDQIAAYDARLGFGTEWHFPMADERHETLTPPVKDALAWIGGLLLGSQNALGRQLDRTVVSASLTPVRTPAACVQSSGEDCTGVADTDGVVYRTPVPGLLKICEGVRSVDACASEPEPLLRAEALVPQFGAQHVLALRNGWGEDNEISAAFAKSGALASFKFASKSSPAVKASGVLADATTAAAGIADAVRTKEQGAATAADAEAAAKAKAETEALQHQIDVLTKQGELAALREKQSDADAASMDEESTRLAAQIAVLRLQKERKELLEEIGGQQ